MFYVIYMGLHLKRVTMPQSGTVSHLRPWTSKPHFFDVENWVSWINKLSIDVWFVMLGHYLAEILYLKIWNLRVQFFFHIDKLIFTFV